VLGECSGCPAGGAAREVRQTRGRRRGFRRQTCGRLLGWCVGPRHAAGAREEVTDEGAQRRLGSGRCRVEKGSKRGRLGALFQGRFPPNRQPGLHLAAARGAATFFAADVPKCPRPGERTQSNPPRSGEKPTPDSARAVFALGRRARRRRNEPNAAGSAEAARAARVDFHPASGSRSKETPGGRYTFEPPLLRLVPCDRFAATTGREAQRATMGEADGEGFGSHNAASRTAAALRCPAFSYWYS
jgi:hypothetical protein